MADARSCEQCGTQFEPRREHARFCSPRCRVAWNREHTGSRGTEPAVLGWSIAAMRDATRRLHRARAATAQQAGAFVSEAVWWVTIVDATLIRYHPGPYDQALAAQTPAERRRTEGTFAGLRYVRNQMGYHLDPAGFIQRPQNPARPSNAPITAWKWQPLPPPPPGSRPRHGQAWEIARYRAYQAHLAGHTTGTTFARAVAFLDLVSAQTGPLAEAGRVPSS
jgi:hypothetical protein